MTDAPKEDKDAPYSKEDAAYANPTNPIYENTSEISTATPSGPAEGHYAALSPIKSTTENTEAKKEQQKTVARNINAERPNVSAETTEPESVKQATSTSATVLDHAVHEQPLQHPIQHPVSMVAWSAIIVGALITASTALILLFLASAMGLAGISPWTNQASSAQAFSIGAAIVLILMQCASSAVGGYLTGRIRSKWIHMPSDEVFFRDTAHGFLSWALATLLTAGFLATAATSAINTGVVAASTVAGINRSVTDITSEYPDGPHSYLVDQLFRTSLANAPEHNIRAQAKGILANAVMYHALPDADRSYLAQLISLHTGLSNTDSLQRVRDLLSQIDRAELILKQNLDIARKAASSVALFTFLSLLMGAFVASIGAALGGHHRDTI